MEQEKNYYQASLLNMQFSEKINIRKCLYLKEQQPKWDQIHLPPRGKNLNYIAVNIRK